MTGNQIAAVTATDKNSHTLSPRLHRCACQSAASKTFSPLTALFTGHTAPELLYLETRWASLVSYGLTALCSPVK
jgi:hypothetical protein